MRLMSLLLCCSTLSLVAADRLAYLNSPCDPYYVGQGHPKLTTPQWVGQSGVEAVVILSIDDMRDPGKYERFLRPLLNRLKKIDGRAPVSIFTNQVEPDSPQLQRWIEEGLSLEVHTIDHPCPLLRDGDFAKAKSTYDRCVDLMAAIPDSWPVAFRMPCCDSLNTPSPRFWTEIFERRTPAGNYLECDSSVFNVFTAADPELPRSLVLNPRDENRFRRYLPFPSFVNTIENYPYPYIVGRTCWEFPCVVPSDWEAQNVQQPNNPDTVRDLKRALDATVIKQGVMPIVFHPHGWIRSEQLVEFVDYAAETYGSRVKFLTFAEAMTSLRNNLQGGSKLRALLDDGDQFRLVDLNGDGFVDVFGSGEGQTRVWNPSQQDWVAIDENVPAAKSRFLSRNGRTHLAWFQESGELQLVDCSQSVWHSRSVSSPLHTGPRPNSVLWHDLDGDGTSELLASSPSGTSVWVLRDQGLVEAGYGLPKGVRLRREDGSDAGVRLRDLNQDGRTDVVMADGQRYGVWLRSADDTGGWQQIHAGRADEDNAIPAIIRSDGTNNGVWFHSKHLWVQNEYTSRLPDLVDRVAYADLVRIPGDATDDAHPFGAALPVQESLQTFSLFPGFRIEVVAAEPEVQDPVAFDWASDGKLWVAEMRDYPNGLEWHGPGDRRDTPGGRIKVLEDKDGDGRFETSTVFLDGLAYPTGVKSWRDGVLITVAPHILFAKDTDGDGVADSTQVLYEGLTEGNQQHRANGLRWGLDHWLHLANGDSGGKVRSLKTEQAVDIRGRDLRIQPDRGWIELTSGQTQFGRNRDNRGNWFGGNNSNPIWHYALDERQAGRNPAYVPPSARRQISDQPGPAPVFPTSQTVERFNDFDRANRFTSACSPEVFRVDQHDAASNDYRSHVFICEPVHNLVHRSEMWDNGVSFRNRRGSQEQQRDFLTSADNWFRPVMCRTAPDSSLWVCDMYRMVIEHPEWIPRQWRERLDHLAGYDRGRIYRVVAADHQPPRTDWQRLHDMDSHKLVLAMDTPNGPLRDMIQQELYCRDDDSIIASLHEVYQSAKWPLVRIPILYLLDHFGALDNSILADAIANGEAPVARHAIRLAEPRLASTASLWEGLAKTVINRIDSLMPGDARCVQQAAYAAAALPDKQSVELLAEIAIRFGEDDHMRAAVLSSLRPRTLEALVKTVVHSEAGSVAPDSHPKLLADLVAMAMANEQRNVLSHLLTAPRGPEHRLTILTLMANGRRKQGRAMRDFLGADGVRSARKLLQQARSLAQDSLAPETDRLRALRLFGLEPEARAEETAILQRLILPTEGFNLQQAAIRALAASADESVLRDLVDEWASFTPAIRAQLLDVLFERSDGLDVLLACIEEGTILPVQVSLHRQQELLYHDEAAIRQRAQAVLKPADTNREEILSSYRAAATSSTDLNRGKSVFRQQCSACHLLDGEGNAVGPDLTALGDKSPASLLVAILDPNRAVEDKYLGYTVLTHDGRQITGLLASETASGMTLVSPDGKQHSVLRSQIEQLVASGKSLMPEGLEQVLSPQKMADLIAYLRGFEAAPKPFPGNTPRVAPVRDDRSIRLFAIHARIYGPSLVFEQKHRNLGYWQSDHDRAVWKIDAPQADKYDVRLIYACPTQPRTNRFQIQVNGQRLGGSIEFTESWDEYRSVGIGTIELPDEPVELTFQSAGPIEGFLLDLQAIHLYPQGDD